MSSIDRIIFYLLVESLMLKLHRILWALAIDFLIFPQDFHSD